MSHMRFLNAGEMMAGLMEFGTEDVFYCVLPLYHGAGGMVVPSVALATGRPFVLRRKFSRSGFSPAPVITRRLWSRSSGAGGAASR